MHRVLLGQLLPVLLVRLNVERVLLDLHVRVAVVGRIGERIVAEAAQHGRDGVHLSDHVGRYLAHPRAQRLQIHRLDHLVRGALHLGQRDLVADELLVMQDGVVPRDVQKVQNVLGGGLRMQHQLLVVDRHARVRSQLDTLRVHVLDDVVPAHQAVPVALQVEARDGDLSRDDRVNGGAAVADHQDELAVREHGLHVGRVAEHERILVAQVVRRLAVLHHHLQNERADGRVDDVLGDAGVSQSLGLLLRVGPLIAHVDEAGNDAGLLAAANARMRVQHGPHERGARARHAAHEYDRHVAIVRKDLWLVRAAQQRLGLVLVVVVEELEVVVVVESHELDVGLGVAVLAQLLVTRRLEIVRVVHEPDDQENAHDPYDEILELDALHAAPQHGHE